MRVNNVSNVNTNFAGGQNSYTTSAGSGAAATTALLGASTGIALVKHPKGMAEVIKDCGGKAGYIKKYIPSLALMAGIGALFCMTCKLFLNQFIPNKEKLGAVKIEDDNAKLCPEEVEIISREKLPAPVKYAVEDSKMVNGRELITRRERLQDGTTRVISAYV